jgi:hypothetical protein
MKTLYEGILKGMDDTLKSGKEDIRAVSKDDVINGITSSDAKKQEKAIDLFKGILQDYYALTYNISKVRNNPESWWVQFDAKNKFTMIRKIGSFYYIVVINQLGCDPIYDRRTHFNSAQTYFDADKKTIYEIDDTMPELDDMCDKILKIMYMR